MNPAAKDVAYAFLRGVSPFVATCPGTRAPSHLHQQAAIKSPKPPPAGPTQQQQDDEIRIKTCQFDTFLPTANPSASKKVIENKDTIG